MSPRDKELAAQFVRASWNDLPNTAGLSRRIYSHSARNPTSALELWATVGQLQYEGNRYQLYYLTPVSGDKYRPVPVYLNLLWWFRVHWAARRIAAYHNRQRAAAAETERQKELLL